MLYYHFDNNNNENDAQNFHLSVRTKRRVPKAGGVIDPFKRKICWNHKQTIKLPRDMKKLWRNFAWRIESYDAQLGENNSQKQSLS